jgi:hypothetical protein
MSKQPSSARRRSNESQDGPNSSVEGPQAGEHPKREKIHGLSQGFLDYVRPYYLGDDSGSVKLRYVLWVDIMGSQGKMLRNVHTAAIPLMKLHVAALGAKRKTLGELQLFPVIDGIYVVSEHFSSIAFFLSDVFRSMAAEFVMLKNWERSIIRGAVAYGPVILGQECKQGSPVLGESDYANSILLGMPLVQAYTAERDAPPFGIYVHESVRAFGHIREHPINTPLWRWWGRNSDCARIAAALLPSLQDYFAWSRSNPVTSGYLADRIDVHRVLVDEYLGEFKGSWKARSATGPKKPEGELERQSDSLSGPERQIKKLQKRFQLTEEQIEQITPIIEKREADVSDLLKDRSLDSEVRRLKIEDVVAQSKAQIRSFFNETQRAILFESEQVDSAPDNQGADSLHDPTNVGDPS